MLVSFFSTCTKKNCSAPPQSPLALQATDVLSTSFIATWNRVLGGYHVFDVATDSSFTNFVSVWKAHPSGSLNSHKVEFLSPNTTYYYRVYATNDCGQSEYSNLISVTTTASPFSNLWTTKSNFGGTARDRGVGFSIGGKGYISTGNDGNPTNDFWEYDTATNAWTQKANFSGTARDYAVGFSIGSKGYIGTGESGTIDFADFWEWDQASNIWAAKANFAGTARQQAVGFSIGSKGYIGTGHDGNNTDDFWEYDPATDAWTQRANFTGGLRNRAVGFSIGTKGYIGTGTNTSVYYNDFWEYNPANDAWIQKANFGGTPRNRAVGFSIATKGYIGTGFDNGSPLPYTKDFWEYNPSTDVWTQKTDIPGTERQGAVGFSVGGKGYIGTGGTGNGTNHFFEFTQ